MFAATSDERLRDVTSQTCGKDVTGSGPKVRRKARTPEVTLPPLCPKPPALSAAFVARPPFSRTPVLQNVPSDRPLSVVELPRLIAQVGPGRAIDGTKWTEGPRLMASALGTELPVRAAAELTTQSLTEKEESMRSSACENKKITTVKDGKATKPNKCPLSGTEVVQIFAQRRRLAELEVYYLKEVDGESYRPYDLQVVPPSEAGSEHFIFSPNSVLHVTDGGFGGVIGLAEWYRESVLWTSLQEIPFFQDFRLRKAFTWWHRNARKILFQRRCEDLQDKLLISVPQFRGALHLFTRLLEDLKETHRLPRDSQTYTLLEFKNALKTNDQECLRILEKLSQYRAVILNAVKENSCKAHQELHLHIEYAKSPNKCYEPIHLHLAHQQQLKKELARSESVLQRLGNFASLINQVLVQSLVTMVRQDAASFLGAVLKREKSQQRGLFHAELCVGASSQLTVDPPVYLFQEAVREALLTVGDTIIQMCDTCGLFLEISSSVLSSDFVQDLTSDLSCIKHPAITGENKSSDGMSGGRKFCCWLLLRDLSGHLTGQQKQTKLMVQGNMVRGCYYPLAKAQLQWYISINDFSKQAEREQTQIMQEAELEIQQLCERYEWLVDINLFMSQWSQASLETMKGQPASQYDEHIKKIRHWAERLNTVPSSISSSNQLFIIYCTHTKEDLGRQLRSIEEQVLEQLVEQIKLHSQSLIADLERATAELETEPQDLHGLSKYALMVRESVKMLADMQKRLDYIHSLQNTVCINYREMTEQELTVEEKMLGLWDGFIPFLKKAECIVCHRLPSAANALDTMYSFLVCDLKNLVSKAASGPFLDPAQNAKEMVSSLSNMYTRVQSLNAMLEQVNRDGQNLQENTLDLTILTTDIQQIKARKDLWELIAVYTTWMEEWKQLLFSEVMVSEAQRQIAMWKEQALSLTSIIPTHDAVLQETLVILESFSHQLAFMAKLQSPTLRHKHWTAIFEGLGLLNVPEKKVTVAELMSQQLEVHQKHITKICRDAQAECNMEQSFQKLQQGWRARLFLLDKFTRPVWQRCELDGLAEREKPTQGTLSNLQTASQQACNDARFIIIGLEMHFAEIESDLMTLSTMLKSPYSFECRQEMGDWVQSLQDLEKLLDLFERYQQMWAFLTKMFDETFFCVQRADLLELFQPVDKAFKEIMRSVSADPHVLRFNSKKKNDKLHGNSLRQVLVDGLSTMESLSNQMLDLLFSQREQFPRLCFLSDREVIQLLSFHPSPFTLQPFVRKCFKGVHWLEVDREIPCKSGDGKSNGATSGNHRRAKVLGVFASLQEHITFLSPLEPNVNASVWLGVFEKQLKLTMVQLIKQCAVVQSQLQPSSQDLACDKKAGDMLLDIASRRKNIELVLDVLSRYPLQCVLVAEEAVWCNVVLQAFQESSPVKLRNIKDYNSATLKGLGRFIRDGVTGPKSESLVSKYTMMCLCALVQLTMNHAQQLTQLQDVQCVLESSFEWLSLLKYHINSEDQSLKGSDDPACYVDVLGHRFLYGYEYFGPEDLMMVHTPSTDRAVLGILLALTSYRCGLVSGPRMSGKKKTAVQLGKALGRQVVIIQCCPSVRPGVLQQMLLGALQTGAWLLLDSVDLLTQVELSTLAQYLVDIHQSFCGLTGNQRVNNEPKDLTADDDIGCTNIVDPQCKMVLAGRSISANRNYGCVLISSKGHTSEVPESLRFATRPVALTHPDYRIIAEVMLTSIGFSEAMSLSQRLVSFISLAKDALCLPDFITDDQICLLVVLQKIISASDKHLKQSARQREISDEATGLAAEKTVVEKDGEESEKPSREPSCHLSITQSLMEETAIVKAILSVLLPSLYEHKKASQFYMILKDAFPIVCQFPLFQQYIEEEEKNQLKDAVTEELQRKRFHSDTEIISSTLTLYQTMKFSQAVLLIGPAGSGKTTCYCGLAGALNTLAAKAAEQVSENDSMTEGNTPQRDPQISASNWSSVNTVVLFPNAMSHDELFGCFCGKRGWQDGAVPKVLRVSQRWEHTSSKLPNSEKKNNLTPIVTWLVLDGEPVGHPGWLDHLTTLCDPEDPFLFLSSGETLVPSQSNLKLLMEITDLSDASPSAVTRCGLVHFTGTDLWKSVWKNEMDILSSDHRLDQGTLKVWSRLAEDLFTRTLSLLRQKALTSAIHKSPTYGLQEIMSFVRILGTLLQDVGKKEEKTETTPQRDKRDIPLHGASTPGIDVQSKQEPLARNLFLVAYVWGFGGHLHPCHWPQFDLLVRQVLFTCRYKIVVPEEESVFEHFFSTDSKMCPKNTLLTTAIIPKYRTYSYLLNLMLEANQPVLLAGDPGSGKTSMCHTLLSFDKPHVSLPAGPLLSSRDLRTIMNDISCQRYRRDTVGSVTKQQRLLLFVDDLHEAPCDAFGKTSTALESLRQSISKGEILTFDNYHFKSLSSATISYVATCCVSASGNHQNNVISPRLSRLFTIFVLPSLSIDVVLSIHSPRLQVWLKDMPLKQSGEDMACCIITATTNLYHAVCDRFQHTLQRPYLVFSHHDLQKVFQGMYLWQPNTGTMQKKEYTLPDFPPVLPAPAASVLNIAHLWMHECMRTFSDRLCSEDESKTLVSLVAKTATTHYGIKLVDEAHCDSIDVPPSVTSFASHTLPTDTAGTDKQIGQSPDTLSPPQEPKPAGHSDLKKADTLMTPHCLPSENNNAEEASLKTPRLQPQILHHMESMVARLVYGPELSESLNSIDQQHDFKCCSCYKEQDLDALMQKLPALVDKKEGDKGHEVDNNYNITSRYILHRQRVSQLLHILRALLIPGGHGVLIGSGRATGRRTTVRLAACLTGYHLMEVHSGNENNLHEILKEAGNRTRVGGGNVIILVHEDVSQSVREELLVAMAHRTYPAHYTEEELRNLVSRVTAVRNSRRYLMDSWMFDKYLSQVHRHVHVFLLMSHSTSDASVIPSNNGVHDGNRQMTKALSLSCCVEVYQPWSSQSLVEVAAQCLQTSPHKMQREGSEASLSVAMAGIHRSACQYASVLLGDQPFSPQTYMEFIAHFGFLCKHLHKQWQGQAIRGASVLSHVDIINNTAVQYKQLLKSLKEKVAETQQHEKVLLRAIGEQKILLEEAQERCVVGENKLYYLEEQIKHAQKEVRPLFLSGLKILKCLNPSDLEEVRHYRDPPDGVVKVLDAVCLLFNRPPGWESAKQLLGQPNFFQELEFYDRYSLTNEQLLELGQIVHSPQFVPELVREVSKACESLCRWVQAVHECCLMQHQLLVKQQLEALEEEMRGHLQLAKQQKEHAYECLDDVKLQLQSARRDLEEQLLELHKAEGMEREAATVAGQLEAHFRDWRAATQEAELLNQNIAGDALILAAIIAYLGPFAPDIRTELLSKWKELCRTGSVNINLKDPRASLLTQPAPAPPNPPLGFPIPVSQRLQLPLGRVLAINHWQLQNTLSARLVVRLLLWGCRSASVQRWPLLADIQQHREISSQSWLITGENTNLETECTTVVCADDPELLDKLEQAAEKGLRVLVTHVERAVPSPQFLARLAPPAGCCPPGLKQHAQPTHPEFHLFLSTHLPVRLLRSEIHPSILARVHVVDLSLSSEEIQELMLTQLLQSECKELLIQHLRFQHDKQLLQKKLVTEQEALMDYILQFNTSLLQDCDFLPRVAVCREAVMKLQAEIRQLSEELDYHEAVVATPRRLVRLAASLYQALQEVSRLSPAYYFSLRGFIAVMQEAFTVKGRPLVSYAVGRVPEGTVPEITNRMVAQLLVQYRPCLFKSHVAVLKLLVSVALLQHDQLCSEGERAAFLRGLLDVEHPDCPPAAPPQTTSQPIPSLPSWIPSHVHPELLCLDRILAFKGLISSLSTSPIQWQQYLHFPSSTVVGAVPCRSHSHLSLLQRALLWKTMLPNCVEGVADAVAACLLCLPGQTRGSEAPHTGNPESLSRYLVKHEGPIILALPSPGGDHWTSIQPLHLINKLADCVAETKEVQVKVISFGAPCDRDVVLSALDKAVKDGHWLVFNNCHLLEQWDEKVVVYLSRLMSSFKEEQYLIHPCFRLWFITQECASCHIPAVVRVCALPLVCDSPWDLKEELSCTLQQVASVLRSQSLLGVTADNMESLLRCAVFHSVLLQRQTYEYSGRGRIYNWSQEDLLALVDAHSCIARLCHDKTKALQYVAVNLVHGGHVLDSADLEVVESVAKTCLSRVSPRWGRGPHVLSNIISKPGRFDLSGLLQTLEKRLQSSDEPHVLGFSADVSAKINKINSHNLNILLRASQTPRGPVRSPYTQPSIMPAYSHTRDRLQALKSFLTNNDSRVTDAGAVSHSCLCGFLLAEWDELIDLVSSLLSRLRQPLQCSASTFASLLELTDLTRLERRAELLCAYLWHRSSSDPPGAYRLSAFRNARGFLVAVMREAAQVNRKYVSDIKLHFQVLSDNSYPASLPLDAVYLCGLELRGASWDAQLEAVQDAVSLQPRSLPLVCVKAQVRSANTARDTFPSKSSDVMDASNAPGSDASQLPVYHCPLYLDEERETGDRGLVTEVPLHARLNPVLCSLRGVRLVSVL